MSIDWKAEYLKSVESGCITLDELREARAELDATNRQVEILSDALAESRREVAALKAVQEPVCHICKGTGEMDHGGTYPWGEAINIPCECTTPPAAQRQWVGLTEDESDEIFNNWPTYNLDHFEFAQVAVAKVFEKNLTTKVTVPDALNPKDENPAYAAGWNDCRAEMLKGNTP